LVYVLVLIAEYNPMTALSLWITSLSLVVGTVGAFALAAMLGADIAAYQRLELDLARTVLAYVGSGSAPASDAPLAGVWRAYVSAADESRRVARSHAYALGPFVVGGFLSLTALLLTILGGVTATQNLLGVGLVVEVPAFFLLLAGGAALALTVGYSTPVPVYDSLAARRWRRNSGRAEAVETALGSIPWLPEFARSARESKIEPTGPAAVPSWRA
jgi:hypothetical protein